MKFADLSLDCKSSRYHVVYCVLSNLHRSPKKTYPNNSTMSK